MNLIIDFGNTLIKAAVFIDNHAVSVFTYKSTTIDTLNSLLSKFPEVNKAIISSVIDHDKSLNLFLKDRLDLFIELNQHTMLPVDNLYKTKETLGHDRIAGIVAANNIFPENNVLVIDAGTAITFDFINSRKQYLGGNISPGLEMRFKALNTFTGKLPLMSRKDDFPLFGDSTADAIISGVQNGIIFEINEYINKTTAQFGDTKTILTGGDTFFFDKKLKNIIFAKPDLILSGLNLILEFNVHKA